ncbi:MAG: 50S ribosomal protein L24 [Candidatus Moranbacteria bacterium]|nr:50S ribosomal protein L24 [Candidatus Moranbacteria bacterium]NTW46159.1 50S ribosomal protein L24 [Candidatus Moranbacteria bacterium]
MKLRKGDEVEVIAGKDRGKRGKILSVLPKEDKVIVEGVNVMKKHRKATRDGASGERIEKPFPVHVSNVMLVCPHTGKPTRVGYAVEGGEKVRVSRRSGKAI